MLLSMFRFECRFFLRQPSFYITSIAFFVLPLMMMSVNRINPAGANALKNSAFSIANMSAFFGAFGLFLVVNFVANTALRNRLSQMDELLYCKPIQPLFYQSGRFLGAYAIVMLVFTMVPLGLLAGTYMPWVDQELLGPNRWSHYLLPYFYVCAPTLLILSCGAYAVALRFRSMMAVNLLALALFLGFDFASELFVTPGYRAIAALMDPFGIGALEEMGRYWSMFERNNEVLTLSGVLLQNRLLWLAIGFGSLLVFGRFQRPLTLEQSKTRSSRNPLKKAKKSAADDAAPLDATVTYRGGRSSAWQVLMSRTLFETKQVLLTPSFLILLVMTAFLILAMAIIPRGMFGTATWPLTMSMVLVIQKALNIVMLVVITFYSAEVIWREKDLGIGEVIDSLPVANATFWLSKLLAVWLVIVILVGFSVCLTITYQLLKGFGGIDLPQYLISLGLFTVLPFLLMTVLAFLLQILGRNKYMGMGLFVLFILSGFAMEPLGLSHNLLQFGRAPGLVYSDMNGYGDYLTTQLWYMTYWGALAAAMALLGYGLWHRGPQQGLKQRLTSLSYQLGDSGKRALMAALLVFVASGSYIYYNTTILNQYVSAATRFDQQANYEKQYLMFKDAPTPTLTKINASVDIYPASRKIIASAELSIENTSNETIERFLVSMPDYSPISQVTIYSGDSSQTLLAGDAKGPLAGPLRTYWFTLDQPILPGEKRRARFDVERSHHGFVDQNPDVQLVRNGTFINNTELFPVFGFQSGALITDRNQRRRRDLPPPDRANKLEEVQHYRQSALGSSSGYIDFETTISTSLDQIAIAPGYLQKQWISDDRAYFHYKMDAPIENYYAFLSARLEVERDEYKGIAIEVYYHATHGVNVPRMVESLKDSLDYYTASFGPYQHRQARIIEFPGYRSFAQSFANTIPYSEQIGFLSDLSDSNAVDSVYFVTAHEMAHQWWGGQVSGANVQGNTLLSESLAHYSALRVTENRYGSLASRKVLQFELDRYLRERTEELVEELPWMRVENQPYIHYRKGVVVMDAIRERIGETRLNQVLADYLADFRFKADPHPTTLDLQARFASLATPAERAFIDRLFEQITLVDIELENIESEKTQQGDYHVTLTIKAAAYVADGQGKETPQPFRDFVEIALTKVHPGELDRMDDITVVGRYDIEDGENRIELTIPQQAGYVLLDPFIKQVDKNRDNNYRAL